MGDDFDPRISKQKREANGDFGPNKNGVPQNILTVKYILHAYDMSKLHTETVPAQHNTRHKANVRQTDGR